MVNFITARWGALYPETYVDKLKSMISRNYPGEHAFRCLREPDFSVDPLDIGFYAKMELFNLEMYDPEKRDQVHVWLDLDMVITGDITPFTIIGSPRLHIVEGLPGSFNSSVMGFRPCDVSWIWDEWVERGKPLLGHTDQDVIQEIAGNKVHLWKGLAAYFNIHYVEMTSPSNPPPDARVLVFCGTIKPHMIPDNKIVKSNWK